ncbi:peptidase domain-containing ABC transporter [Pseudoduganella ginsengisoli]|uniref:Cyclolysin secretion/processing ATP-binding protein CyaB n=1 Tax=Pseudoduganella ginsengisoli TaxID=1462440 RepID=A0A6L6Q2K0_9BURK|nr:peptidase domain-containing ABC transporter [Pseudoduganella ginsengisoli]MTW03644.1 ATP-binding cassette domain-containing protein [Pseudoduganella ginsengisoli]
MNLFPFLNLSFLRERQLPVLLQTESAECGLASLGMIAGYWGYDVDLASLRRRFAISVKGATLRGVVAIAGGMGLRARALKLEMHNLSELKLPCILHWNMNHFVVLKSVSPARAVIHDPAIGERSLRLDEFANYFTGVALELSPADGFEKRVEKQHYSLLSLMGRVTGLKSGMARLVILGLALQVCALIAPFYMQWIIDEALLAADYDMTTVLGIGFLLLVVVQTAIGGVRSWMTTVLSTDLNFQWLSNAFTHLMKLPLPYFEKRNTGDIVSRFGSIQTIQRRLTTQFVEGAIDGVLVLGTLGMMLMYSATLAGVAAIAVSLYLALRWSIYHALKNATAEQIVHSAKQQQHFMESVRGVQSVRLFGRADERRAGWMNKLADQFNAELRVSRLSVSYETANTLLFSAERVLVIWLAAVLVLDNKLSVGMLFAFISYKDQFSQRMSNMIDKLFEFRMLHLHGERVADIVMSDAEEDAALAEVDPDTIEPVVEVRNLSFRYADSEPYILQGMNLRIEAGQCIAITGASGSGKTTLMKLLLGLLEPTEGEILVGGFELRKLGMSNYRTLVGTVMQDDGLFAGSVAENICFFSPTPDMMRIQTCARLAAIEKDIMAMPMAYNTLVGDIGSGLSGGQKQRILLARALYKNPKVLVLDEATSHLDVANERAVNAAIRQAALTRIIVAHRPETIAMAERIIVMAKGQVASDTLSSASMERRA